MFKTKVGLINLKRDLWFCFSLKSIKLTCSHYIDFQFFFNWKEQWALERILCRPFDFGGGIDICGRRRQQQRRGFTNVLGTTIKINLLNPVLILQHIKYGCERSTIKQQQQQPARASDRPVFSLTRVCSAPIPILCMYPRAEIYNHIPFVVVRNGPTTWRQ